MILHSKNKKIWNHDDYTKSSAAIQKSGTDWRDPMDQRKWFEIQWKKITGQTKTKVDRRIEKSPMDQGQVKAANMCCGP